MQLTDAQMRLYAITDDRWLNGRTLYDCVEDALKGGVTMLQIREKHCSTEELTALAIPIVSLCHRYHVPCIINDDVQAAKDSGADGVNVGQDDASIAQARAVLGAGKWIGTSAHNVAEARKAQQDGVKVRMLRERINYLPNERTNDLPQQVTKHDGRKT